MEDREGFEIGAFDADDLGEPMEPKFTEGVQMDDRLLGGCLRWGRLLKGFVEFH